jgi:hypothetical protein
VHSRFENVLPFPGSRKRMEKPIFPDFVVSHIRVDIVTAAGLSGCVDEDKNVYAD